MRNFEEGWDLQRLIVLVGQTKKHKACPLHNVHDIHAELERWNKARNKKAHDSISGTERELFTDEELGYFIGKGKLLLPRINGWKKDSMEARRIADRLNELQACLDGEEVSNPTKHPT